MAAAMGGLDALIFTGGVGENAPRVRAHACERLGFLGVALDDGFNSRRGADREIGAADSRVRVLVIAAREDLQIAHEVRAVLASGATRAARTATEAGRPD
jgi:acetate kinase